MDWKGTAFIWIWPSIPLVRLGMSSTDSGRVSHYDGYAVCVTSGYIRIWRVSKGPMYLHCYGQFAEDVLLGATVQEKHLFRFLIVYDRVCVLYMIIMRILPSRPSWLS